MSPTTAQTISFFAAVAGSHRVTMTRMGRPDPTGKTQRPLASAFKAFTLLAVLTKKTQFVERIEGLGTGVAKG